MKKQQLRGVMLAILVTGVGMLAVTAKEGKADNSLKKQPTIDASKQTEDNADTVAKMQNFNDSTRYAFVTDKAIPQLAVIDLFERQKVTTIDLKATAERIGISKVAGFIAYAKRGERVFYQLDLSSLVQKAVAVSQPIDDLIVHGDGKWVSYSSDNTVTVVTLRTGKTASFATQGKTALLYHPSNDSLFIAELERGRVQRINLVDNSAQTLFDLGKPMSPISVMPNGMAFFFVAEGLIHRYSLLDEMLSPLDIQAATFRPYMTSDGRMLLALGNQQPTELLAINAYTYQVETRFPLKNWQQSPDNQNDFVMTGWLEQVAVLADEQAIFSLSFDHADSLTLKDNETDNGAVRDMLVQSDSKTLLMTREGSQQLGVFDMKSQSFREGIALDLAQPEQVIMGETNTLCH